MDWLLYIALALSGLAWVLVVVSGRLAEKVQRTEKRRPRNWSVFKDILNSGEIWYRVCEPGLGGLPMVRRSFKTLEEADKFLAEIWQEQSRSAWEEV